MARLRLWNVVNRSRHEKRFRSVLIFKASTTRPASYLFLYEPYGVLRVSLLCLFDLRDGVGPHPPQRVFGLVAELFGQLGEVLPVFPRHSAEMTRPQVRAKRRPVNRLYQISECKRLMLIQMMMMMISEWLKKKFAPGPDAGSSTILDILCWKKMYTCYLRLQEQVCRMLDC